MVSFLRQLEDTWPQILESVVQRVSNPVALGFLVFLGMYGAMSVLSGLVGPPDRPFLVGPDGTVVLDPLFFPII